MHQFIKKLSKTQITKDWFESKPVFAHLSPFQEAVLLLTEIEKGQKVAIIKENEADVIRLFETIRALDEKVCIAKYMHESSLRIESISESDVMKFEQIDALHQIVERNADIVLISTSAALRKISKREVLEHAYLEIKREQVYPPKKMLEDLYNLGYQRVKYVDRPFTFAHRGGVIDVYSLNHKHPIRIEFFDDEIDSLRFFDVQTQRSQGQIEKVKVLFASEVLLTQQNRLGIVEKIQKLEDAMWDDVAMKLDQFSQGNYEVNMYPFLSYGEDFGSVLDLLDDYRVIGSPVEAIDRFAQTYFKDSHDFLKEQKQLKVMTYDQFTQVFHPLETIWSRLDFQTYEYEAKEKSLHIPWHEENIFFQSLDEGLAFFKNRSEYHRVVLAADSQTLQQFEQDLKKDRIDYEFTDEMINESKGLYLYPQEIQKSFRLEDFGVEVYSYDQVFKTDKKKYRYDHKFYEAESLERLQDLDNYDYVVHRQYGIGKYMGIYTREYDGIAKDFMKIMYQGGDELYVPLEKFHLVRKYLSKDAQAVRLNKLGSKTWEKNKAKVKEDVAQLADHLVKLYAERSNAQGFAFSPDHPLQKEFEKSFPYDLTPDQKKAIEEIKADMEKPVPMDRLLSGDVGFGKTEVAIRAAFKAVMDGKQVAFLCPTTILSSQHYQTFVQRFENYPVNIALLNRFTSVKEQSRIIEGLKQGSIDIVIGTHRILSKDVRFKDLGFLIIDEEQRFGVQDKEKMKAYRVSVDVLSLSATPIPRTLQMSLVGLRSLSQLNTPPQNRLPVMSYVIEKDEKVLHDVIVKELHREGQVFYLYNNVPEIYHVANRISEQIPESRVGVVHGQMDRDDIEDVMIDFYAKKINVLVCTTIIETGIDIPNANTMIIDNAHRFGLSQLYQIKGRVGRSDRLAYAYFVVPKKKNLSEVAQKRLQAIKEFSQLGSGYKIAMRDLSIRGAGEILGARQSGFIDTVGIELYVELLKEAIAERKGEKKIQEKDSPTVQTSAYLPDDFAHSDSEKLDVYEEFESISSLEDWENLYHDLEDRYGHLPESVENLLMKTKLELYLQDDHKIEFFQQRPQFVVLRFTKEYSDKIDGIALFGLLSEMSYDIKVSYVKQKIEIQIPITRNWLEDYLHILENIKEVAV